VAGLQELAEFSDSCQSPLVYRQTYERCLQNGRFHSMFPSTVQKIAENCIYLNGCTFLEIAIHRRGHAGTSSCQIHAMFLKEGVGLPISGCTRNARAFVEHRVHCGYLSLLRSPAATCRTLIALLGYEPSIAPVPTSSAVCERLFD